MTTYSISSNVERLATSSIRRILRTASWQTRRGRLDASIAVVWFALSSYPWPWNAVGSSARIRDTRARGPYASLNAARKIQVRTDRHNGFYYHFLDMRSGKRAGHCELSPIDTSFLVAGILTAAAYFTDPTSAEAEIREASLAGSMNGLTGIGPRRQGHGRRKAGSRVRFSFTTVGRATTKRLFFTCLARVSQPPPAADQLRGWTRRISGNVSTVLTFCTRVRSFIHHFSHAWIDFRKIQDPFMREKGSDYFENSRRRVTSSGVRTARPKRIRIIWSDCWGLSAGDGRASDERVRGRQRRFFGYTARGAPYGPDDGTIAPAAALDRCRCSGLRALCCAALS